MKKVSIYDDRGFLTTCTVLVDCDNLRVGVFITDSELVRATTELSLAGILYHITVYQIPKDKRPHRKEVQSGYLQVIKDNWLTPGRIEYYKWLASQNSRVEPLRISQKYAERLEYLELATDMRELYDSDSF